jgi:hypothetical protein
MARLGKQLRVPVPRPAEHALDSALDAVMAVQQPVVLAYVERVRNRHPGATPDEVIVQLERRYLAAVVGIGAAAGSAAAMPGVGTAASLASGVAEISAFVSATAMYVLAEAEVHGVPTHDPEVRRALVLAVLLGEGSAVALEGAGAASPHWARVVGQSISKEKIPGINSHLSRLLVARFGVRQGALLIGRALPLGLGAGIGAAGNAALGRAAIASARRTFGPPPTRFGPRVIEGSVSRSGSLDPPRWRRGRA